jgi:hypothetical protein
LTVLEYLHGLSPPVIHRDITPHNVMRRKSDGQLVLVDFGSVRDALVDPQIGGQTVTGTFGYMAPEQFYGKASPASDLYALGALAVALLSRRQPNALVDDQNRIAFRSHIAVSAATAALLDRLLAPASSERLQRVDQATALVHKALDDFHHPRPQASAPLRAATASASSPRWPMAALIAVGVVFFGFVAMTFVRQPMPETPLQSPRQPQTLIAPEPVAGPEPVAAPTVKPTHPRIRVQSDPSGADVLRGSVKLGMTPLVLLVVDSNPTTKPIKLTLRKRGYQDLVSNVTVTAEDTSLFFHLVHEKPAKRQGSVGVTGSSEPRRQHRVVAKEPTARTGSRVAHATAEGGLPLMPAAAGGLGHDDAPPSSLASTQSRASEMKPTKKTLSRDFSRLRLSGGRDSLPLASASEGEAAGEWEPVKRKGVSTSTTARGSTTLSATATVGGGA